MFFSNARFDEKKLELSNTGSCRKPAALWVSHVLDDCFVLCICSSFNGSLLYSPAKRILMRSNGCRISVDATPPETPATRCSYLTWANTLNLGGLLAGAAFAFIFLVLCAWLVQLTVIAFSLSRSFTRRYIYIYIYLYIYVCVCMYCIIYNLWPIAALFDLWKIRETRYTWPQFALNLSCC